MRKLIYCGDKDEASVTLSQNYSHYYTEEELQVYRKALRERSFPVTNPSIFDDKSGKKTNADRIRSMSDEELAEWFDGDLPSHPKEWWIDWLKEVAE